MHKRTIFKVHLLVLGLVLLFSCKNRQDYSSLSDWETAIWEQQVIKSGSKMWRESKGGRSWTVEDEHLYDKWVAGISPKILADWDIPSDCADSVMAIRFIFALKHGLAIRFGYFKSTDYWYRPMELLKAAARSYGTKEIDNFSYLVDMWDFANYQGGNFVLQKGHSYTVSGLNELNVLTTLSSGPPITVKALAEGNFFIRVLAEQQFRRFFSYLRDGSRVYASKEISFTAHPRINENGPNWYDCSIQLEEEATESQKTEKKVDRLPLWKSIYNFVLSKKLDIRFNKEEIEREGIQCPHNVYWQPKYLAVDQKVPEEPNFTLIANEMFTDLCKYLQERVEVVDKGFDKCFGKNIASCTKGSHGDYSTPSRDARIIAKAAMLQHLIGELEMGNEFIQKKCSLTLHPFLEDREKELNKEVSLLGIVQGKLSTSIWIMQAFSLLYENYASARSYDPTRSYPERWGCSPLDKNLSCLDQISYRDIAFNIHWGYPFDVVLPTQVRDLNKNLKLKVTSKNEMMLANDAMRDSLPLEGESSINCFLPTGSEIEIQGFSYDSAYTLFKAIRIGHDTNLFGSLFDPCKVGTKVIVLTESLEKDLAKQYLAPVNFSSIPELNIRPFDIRNQEIPFFN